MRAAEYTIAGRHVVCWSEQQPVSIVVYANVFGERREELASLVPLEQMTLVTIDSIDWNRDFSPWPAPRVFRSEDDFAGNGDDYLAVLTDEIIPTVESNIGVPSERIIAGYSLAGLFALYSLCGTKAFTRAVCASPSLWYDGFVDFMKKHNFLQQPKSIYFSLGDKEKKTRNQRMKIVEDAIRDAKNYIASQGIATTFVLNEGNHFQHSMERLAKGIHWTLDDIQRR